jgi:ABC-type molybdate transport system substrate-binding protein
VKFVFAMCLMIRSCLEWLGQNEKVTLTVSAAASAQDALEEIQTNYEKSHSNVTRLSG